MTFTTIESDEIHFNILYKLDSGLFLRLSTIFQHQFHKSSRACQHMKTPCFCGPWDCFFFLVMASKYTGLRKSCVGTVCEIIFKTLQILSCSCCTHVRSLKFVPNSPFLFVCPHIALITLLPCTFILPSQIFDISDGKMNIFDNLLCMCSYKPH